MFALLVPAPTSGAASIRAQRAPRRAELAGDRAAHRARADDRDVEGALGCRAFAQRETAHYARAYRAGSTGR